MVFLNCRGGLLCNKLTWFLSSPAAFYLDLQSDILFQDHCKVIVVLLLMASDSNEMGHLNKTIQLGDFCICTVRPSLSHVNARQRDTIWKLDPGRWQQLTLFSISWYVCQVRITVTLIHLHNNCQQKTSKWSKVVLIDFCFDLFAFST